MRSISRNLGLIFIMWALVGCRIRSQKNSGGGSGLASISVVTSIADSKVIGKVISENGQERAAFYFVNNGQEQEIETKDKLELKRSAKDKTYQVFWVTDASGRAVVKDAIGRADADGQKLEICGSLTNSNYENLYGKICDVTYIQASSPKEKHLMIIGMRQDYHAAKYGSSSVKLTQSRSFQLDGYTDRVDISAPATPEINQGSTGTCLYNSTAGILEWYQNLKTGRNERLSAIDVLARLDNRGQAGEIGAINATASLGGIVPDQNLPTQQTYNQYPDFNSVYNYSRSVAETLSGNRYATPRIQAKTLFMRAQPARGQPGTPGAADAEMQQIRQWLFTYKRPVHFFAYYGSIWHAIIALGWDDTNNMILIKDSLQESGQKAQWKSISVYQPIAYGAVGTIEAEAITGNPNEGGGATDSPSGGSGTPSGGSSMPGGSIGPAGSLVSTALAKENGQWRMYIYSQKPASYFAILAADNRWYYSDRYYSQQNGWKTIGSIAVDIAWQNRKSVRVFVNYQDGTQSDKEISIDDIRN